MVAYEFIPSISIISTYGPVTSPLVVYGALSCQTILCLLGVSIWCPVILDHSIYICSTLCPVIIGYTMAINSTGWLVMTYYPMSISSTCCPVIWDHPLSSSNSWLTVMSDHPMYTYSHSAISWQTIPYRLVYIRPVTWQCPISQCVGYGLLWYHTTPCILMLKCELWPRPIKHLLGTNICWWCHP